MSQALVLGDPEDAHVAAVCERLIRPPIVVDVASLASMRFCLRDGRLELDDGANSCTLSVDEPVRGWLRRVAPQNWQTGVVPESRAFAEMSSWLALVTAVVRDDFAHWLTELDASVRADNKLVVQQAARKTGVRMPWTVVTNDPGQIPADLDDSVVAKPLGPGHFLEPDGAYSVFATAVPVRTLNADALSPAPFLIQEHLHAARHRRVVTVAGRVWSGVLDASGLPLDWRSEPAAHDSFRVDEPPSEVATGAAAIARQLDLGYSSQDWVETTAGEHVLLDVNPAGQWLFLPTEITDAVTGAIANWLNDDQ